MAIKIALVVVLGAPVAGVIAFEIILNGAAMFNHANLRLPKGVDSILRIFIVTPDMHRVHHSLHRDETDSNYGFNFPWWDRLCGTYRPNPRDGHQDMNLGIQSQRQPRRLHLAFLLLFPFLGAQTAPGGTGNDPAL